ncbi:hypothetical protein [Paenibacillus sp. NPDC058071]|uniref:hypothetical protein n=1 Tax=Paenibacillus sp. NPDC058071 TaxID=3346326 RepID=UPI0036DB0C33
MTDPIEAIEKLKPRNTSSAESSAADGRMGALAPSEMSVSGRSHTFRVPVGQVPDAIKKA